MKYRRRSKKINILSLFVKALVTLLIISFAAYLGIKILVNLLYLTSKLLPEKQTPTVERRVLKTSKPSLIVLSLPEATNEAKIKATLFSDNAEKVKVYLNDKLNKTIPIEEENIELEIEGLKKGKNLVYFVASLQEETLKTKEYTIVYDNTPPKLEITAPENFETTESQIEIRGKTEPKVIVKVNLLPVIVSKNGEFYTSLNLEEGENKIVITAQDEAGNTTEKQLTIVKTSQ